MTEWEPITRGAAAGAPLDPDVAALRRAALAAGARPLCRQSLAKVRSGVARRDLGCVGGPDVAAVDADVSGLPVRAYGPSGTGAVLVYAHGGGWVSGGLDYADNHRFLHMAAAVSAAAEARDSLMHDVLDLVTQAIGSS